MNTDVMTLGEALIDFTESGQSKDGRRLFEQNPGGAPANVICALAKLGLQTAFTGKVGDDMHGRLLKAELEACGVDVTGLILDPDVFTTLAFVALTGGERSFSFARKPGADTCLRPEELPPDLEQAKIFHFGSLSLTDEPVRSATFAALERAKRGGALISYDPNYRAALWPNADTAAEWMRKPLSYVDIMKLSDEETALLTGEDTPSGAAQVLHGLGIKLTAVTLGKAGAYVSLNGEGFTAPGFDIPAVDTTGAGDAFWAGFLYRFLQTGKSPETLVSEDLREMALYGNAAATLCVTKRGGIPAMPRLDELVNFLQKN